MRPQLRSFILRIVGIGCAVVAYLTPLYAQEGPRINAGVVEEVGDQWQTVLLRNTYAEMVVVAVPAYSSDQPPAVARIRNASGNSFEVRVQNPSDEELKGYRVHYMVVEAGVYTETEHGIQLEAAVIASELVDYAGAWDGEAFSYKNQYAAPVIIGQVMSFNDERWSVFWARGLLVGSPPGQIARIGRHVGEDADREREPEDLGYIVFESGLAEPEGFIVQAFLGENIVSGVGNGAPFEYDHDVEEPEVALLAVAGMNGNNGGWPVLWGENELGGGFVNVAFDEDQLFDDEREHTTEELVVVILQSTQALPQVSSFSPPSGSPGTDVTIRGVSLSGIVSVSFNGVPAASLEVLSDQALRVTVPEGADTGVIQLIGEDGFEVGSQSPFIVTFEEAATGINLCRLTAAMQDQSSEISPFLGAVNACDGILSGTQAAGTISATNVESESWWEVDLGAIYNIAEVRMINRTDCCQEDLANYFVFVSDAPFVSKSAQVTLAEPNVLAYFVGEVGTEADVLVGQPGRFVRLQYPGVGVLGLSEVEVIAANGQVVHVANESEESISESIELGTPFPSPMKSVGTLYYTLPETMPVQLRIYDMLGREVGVLEDGVRPGGTHAVTFSTVHLARGVYTIQLLAGGTSAVQSFIRIE